MSQNALILPTTGTVSGLTMTQDTNAAIDTLRTNNSGNSAPASSEAYQTWFDTSNNQLYLLSGDATTWIPIFTFNQSSYTAFPTYASYNQGGFVNKFRNGNFVVAQRGISGTVTSSTGSAYTLDGWIVGAAGGSAIWSQGVNAGYNILDLTCSSGLTDVYVRQRIESTIAASMANVSTTVQWRILNLTGATITPTLTIRHASSADVWGASSITDVSSVSLSAVTSSGGLVVVAYTFTAAVSSGNGLEATIDFGSSLNASSGQVQISQADIRPTPGLAAGINYNPPVFENRPIAIELPFCQRYLYYALQSTNSLVGFGVCYSTNNFDAYIPLPATMRLAGSALNATFPTAAHVNANGLNCSSLSNGSGFASGIGNVFAMSGTVSSGLSSGQAVSVRWGSTSDSLTLSAEL